MGAGGYSAPVCGSRLVPLTARFSRNLELDAIFGMWPMGPIPAVPPVSGVTPSPSPARLNRPIALVLFNRMRAATIAPTCNTC